MMSMHSFAFCLSRACILEADRHQSLATRVTPAHPRAYLKKIATTILGLVMPSVVALAQVEAPCGVFALFGESDGNPNAIFNALQNSNVDGASIRLSWDKLEPAEGTFDFQTYINAAVQQCLDADKPCILRIGTGGDDATTSSTNGSKPHWLIQKIRNAGGTFVDVDDDGVTKSIPVYWDPTLIAAKKDMYDALGAHFNNAHWQLSDGSRVVRHIEIAIANQNTEDWAVDDSPTGTLHWQQAGWKNRKVINAAVDLATSVAISFPNQTIGFAFNPSGWNIDNPNMSEDHHRLEKSVISALISALGTRFVPQKNNLNALQGPPTHATQPPNGGNFDILTNDVLPANQPRAAQDVWNVSNDQTEYRYNGGTPDNIHTIFGRGTATLGAIGAVFIETYATDCTFDWRAVPNPNGSTPGRDEIARRHNVMVANCAALPGP
jgi:Beta-galactosidase